MGHIKNCFAPSLQPLLSAPRKLRSDSAHRVAELPRLNPCSSSPAAKTAWIWLNATKVFWDVQEIKTVCHEGRGEKDFVSSFHWYDMSYQSFASDWSKDDTEIEMKTKIMKMFCPFAATIPFWQPAFIQVTIDISANGWSKSYRSQAVHHQTKLL